MIAILYQATILNNYFVKLVQNSALVHVQDYISKNGT